MTIHCWQRYLRYTWNVFVVSLLMSGSLKAQDDVPTVPEEIPAQVEQVEMEPEVLEEGPLHEAFAEPYLLERTEPQIVPQQPPEPIDELPPEIRPEGNRVEWIPGYWMWSPQREGFIWVSGVWRKFPPRQQWVPGHWAEVEGGYQWIHGFWAPTDREEVNYLPLPPESLEAGPTSPAPGGAYFWVPGCWRYRQQRYVWRPGYWYAGQPGWIWTPARYVYTPRGAIYLRGFWDYPFYRRGLPFAPIYFRGGVRPGYRYAYRPRTALDTGLLLASLFIDRNRGHYYYGRGRGRYGVGRRPWYEGYGRGRYYDPLAAYHRWHDGRNRDDWYRDFSRRWLDSDRDGDRNRDFDRQRAGRDGRSNVQSLLRNVEEWAGTGDRRRDALRRLTEDERGSVRRDVERRRDLQSRRAKLEDRGEIRRNVDRVRGDEGRGPALNQRNQQGNWSDLAEQVRRQLSGQRDSRDTTQDRRREVLRLPAGESTPRTRSNREEIQRQLQRNSRSRDAVRGEVQRRTNPQAVPRRDVPNTQRNSAAANATRARRDELLRSLQNRATPRPEAQRRASPQVSPRQRTPQNSRNAASAAQNARARAEAIRRSVRERSAATAQAQQRRAAANVSPRARSEVRRSEVRQSSPPARSRGSSPSVQSRGRGSGGPAANRGGSRSGGRGRSGRNRD